MGRLANLIASRAWTLIRRSAAEHTPIPLDVLLDVRPKLKGEDPLFSSNPTVGGIANSFLAQNLADTLLGEWTLDAPTINYLEKRVKELSPARVLELGSGISTVCLARFLQEHSVTGEVVSLEQDLEQVNKTNELLARFELAGIARVIHSPLIEKNVLGMNVSAYSDFTPLEGSSFDMLLIDGPSAEPGARLATLPLAGPYLKDGAAFFLDDALRDGELEAARKWRELPEVTIEGIVLFDKGMLVGTWKQPGRA